ncbi:MAG: hypothetical protein ACRDL8_02310 [Solirubrobacteraceae bacterium]
MSPRRVVNIGLLVLGAMAVGGAALAATSGGHSASTGNAQACDAFWNWYDSTGSTPPAATAYHKATTQPLIADLYNVSVGLRDQAKGLNGDKAANAAFAQKAANLVIDDCTKVGYPDPSA